MTYEEKKAEVLAIMAIVARLSDHDIPELMKEIRPRMEAISPELTAEDFERLAADIGPNVI